MESLTIKMLERYEEAAIWPEASPEERLNSTAMMLLLDNTEVGNIFYIHFTTDNAAGTITYRTTERPEILRKLRQILDWVPELVIIESTV